MCRDFGKRERLCASVFLKSTEGNVYLRLDCGFGNIIVFIAFSPIFPDFSFFDFCAALRLSTGFFQPADSMMDLAFGGSRHGEEGFGAGAVVGLECLFGARVWDAVVG